MLWTIFVILLVLWLLGIVSSYTLGGIHSPSACACGHRIDTSVGDGAQAGCLTEKKGLDVKSEPR
jgi:hypothetical protein